MKNLSELKLNAHRFQWSMLQNTWFDSVPEFLSAFRPVSRVQTQKLAFTTIKNGISTESWTDFPKAKNLSIKALENGDYIVEFIGETEKHCSLTYLLKPITAFKAA
jgi:hypothetical protein